MMNGNQALEILSKMTPEQRSLTGLIWCVDDEGVPSRIDRITEFCADRKTADAVRKMTNEQVAKAIAKAEPSDDVVEEIYETINDAMMETAVLANASEDLSSDAS